MIPEKEDSMFGSPISDVESVIDWFDGHKQAFYTLGLCYLSNQELIEKLFYRTIVQVHKESIRFKRNASFEIRVTSIFLEHCRELSDASGEKKPRHEILEAIDQLQDDEKEALLLTYVTGFSKEEAARILRVSLEKMKELIYSGIHSLRKHLYDTTYHGCKEYQKKYIDYLEKSMDRPEKIEFEMHIYHCPECQEDLGAFQDIMLNLEGWMNDFPVPPSFMENVRKRLIEREEHRQKKQRKRKKLTFISVSILSFLIAMGFGTGVFPHVYYAWTEEDEQLRAFLQQDLGQRLNLEAESGGVKVKIRGVVADDVQTLVFYEIEDTNENNQYFMQYEDGLAVKNENEIMNQLAFPQFYPPDIQSEMNKKEKHVFYGKVSLRPMEKDTGKVILEIRKLVKLIPDSVNPFGMNPNTNEYKTGEWTFEVPVTKQPSTDYALDKQIEVEGIPVQLEKLTVAPTITILEYDVDRRNPEKRLEHLTLDDLEVNGKKVKVDPFGTIISNYQDDPDSSTFQSKFDPLYGEKPNEVKVGLESAYFNFEEIKSIELDVNQQYPQTFEYAGSTISIDKIEVGQPTTIVISDHEIENRKYEMFNWNIVPESEQEHEHEPLSMQMETEEVYVDKNGTKYDPMRGNFDYEKIEQPRHFITSQTLRLDGDNIIPKRLDLFGYTAMKYLDVVVKIKLD